MKRIFGIFLALFLTTSVWATPAKVTGIKDGDTFWVVFLDEEKNSEGAQVRFINADAPEELKGICKKEKQLGKVARERLEALMPVETVVELENITKDKHDKRIKANVILSDGRDVGQVLISEKVARSYSDEHESWCK